MRVLNTCHMNVHTVRNGLNLGCLPDGLDGVEAALGVDKVRRKDGVDEGRLSEPGLTCSAHSFFSERLACAVAGYLPTTMTLNWKPRLSSLCSIWRVIESKPT